MLNVESFLNVLMTKNVSAQLEFYRNKLGLELIFENNDTFGLGKNGQLFLVIREDKNNDSHHLAEQKGPILMTFKCSDDASSIKTSDILVRNEVKLAQYNTHYIFIEDIDGNELCLDFQLNL